MAKDDIYKNQQKYGNFINRLDEFTKVPTRTNQTYYCKNPQNIQYFRKMIPHFEMLDLSFLRRIRVLQNMRLVVYVTEKDLVHCTREDIDQMVIYSNTKNNSIESKKDFIKNIKYIWRVLFPECDREGRIDNTITPYPVRHLSCKISKAQEKLRNDRVTWDEFQQIVNFFSGEAQIQAYLMLAFESLGRPQEILYTKIKDYEFYDDFAKIWISEHGKVGTGFLQCIDSYPYIVDWHRQHPYKTDPNAYFFISKSNRNQFCQMKNIGINVKLKYACKRLGISKNVTCYSLKRNGVTFRRKRGDSDLQIQHAARWTSTKQLKIYDMTTQEDALKIELHKCGIKNKVEDTMQSGVKMCVFCSQTNGFTADFCSNCRRPLDRNKIEEIAKAHERMMNNELIQRLDRMEKIFSTMTNNGVKQNSSSLL